MSALSRTGDAGGASGGAWRKLRVDPLGLAGVVLLVAVWWLIAATSGNTRIPSPDVVWAELTSRLWHDEQLVAAGVEDPGFVPAIGYTALNVATATAIGTVVGVAIGLLGSRIAPIRALLDPFLVMFGVVPVLIVSPFLVLWFGISLTAQIGLVVISTALVLALYTRGATKNLSPVHEQFARTLGANRFQVMRDVIRPGILPELIAGIRIALASAWGLEVIAELLGAPTGVGRVLDALGPSLNVGAMLAIVVLLAVVAALADAIVATAGRWLIRWQH